MESNFKNKTRKKLLMVFVILAMVLSLFPGMADMVNADSATTVMKVSCGGETKTITAAQWDTLKSGEAAVTATYSTLTQKPEATPVSTSETGVKLTAVLTQSGVDATALEDSQSITFTNVSGNSLAISKGEIFADRYVFTENGEGTYDKGAQVYPIITNEGRLMVGQKTATDANAQLCRSDLFSCQKDTGGKFTSFADSDYTTNDGVTAINVAAVETIKFQIKYGDDIIPITESMWDSATKVTETYSCLSKKGNGREEHTGVKLTDLLTLAQIDAASIGDDQKFQFISSDGTTSDEITVKYLLNTTRYSYQLDGDELIESNSKQVYPIIDNSGCLIFGQESTTDVQKMYWRSGLFNADVSKYSITLSKPVEVPTGYASGTGTKDDPYIISTASHLRNLSTEVNGGKDYDGVYFKLSDNIDLNNEAFTPIGGGARLDDGTATYKFKGSFNGNGKKITNLKVETTTEYTGLFGYNEGTVSDFTLEGSVTCSSAVPVSSNGNPTSDFVGGAVGFNAGAIKGVISKVSLTAPYSGNVGGIAGFNTSGKWRDATSGSDVNRTIEGAVGMITECGNEGNIKSYYKVGGIVGENEGYIRSCYNKGDIYVTYSGSGNGQAGIAGRSGCNNSEWGIGHISNCYNTGSINTKALESLKNGEPYYDSKWISGITGFSSKSSTITNCYTVGTMYKGYDDYAPIAPRGDSTVTLVNNYSLDTIITMISGDSTRNGIRRSSEQMKGDLFVTELGGAFVKDSGNINNGYPVLKWQQGTKLSVKSLEADISGAKVDYVEEEKFTTDGINIYAVYDDGSKELINPMTYTVSKTDAFALADDKMKVTVGCDAYGLSVSKELEVSVVGQVLDSVVVYTAPTKHTYKSGEKFDPAGMRLRASYTNANTKTLTTGFTVDNPNTPLTENDNTITVSYTQNGVTRSDSFDVVVVDERNGPAKDQDGTYLIGTADELVWFAKNVSLLGNTAINGKLTANIDVSKADFIPIGTGITNKVTTKNEGSIQYKYSNYYMGTFDGNSKKITMALEGTTYMGIFGYTNGGVIKDLTSAGTVKGTGYVGGIVGNSTGTVSISGCKNEAEITMLEGAASQNNAGGIAGSGASGTIENCVNTAAISGNGARVGGIIGYGSALTVKDSVNSGNITSTGMYVGGIAGYGKIIENCDNSGNVTGGSATAGILGRGAASAVIKVCSNTGNVEGNDGVGGINGSGYVIGVENCYNTGNIKATAAIESDGVGGIIGTKGKNYVLTVANCYNTGTVNATGGSVKTTTGEIIGFAPGATSKYTTINNSYYLAGADKKSIGSTLEEVEKINVDNSAPKTLAELSAIAVTLGETYKDSCSGAVFTRQTAVEHTAGEWADNTATFTEPGTETKKCTICGKVVDTREAVATGVGITEGSIAEIGTVVLTQESKDKIAAARAYYNRLTTQQQPQVSNYSTLTAAESRMEQLMKPVNDTIQTINDIPKSITGADNDIELIFAAQGEYDGLSDKEKAFLPKETVNRLNAAKVAVGAANHSSNDVTVEGIPWYAKIVVEPKTEGDDYDAMKDFGKDKSRTLLGMYDINLLQYSDGAWVKYDLDGQSVTVTIVNDAFKGYHKALAIHQTEIEPNETEASIQHSHEVIDATITGNKATFKAAGFSSYGITAEKMPASAKTGDDFNLLPILVIMLIAAVGATIVVMQRRKRVQ